MVLMFQTDADVCHLASRYHPFRLSDGVSVFLIVLSCRHFMSSTEVYIFITA